MQSRPGLTSKLLWGSSNLKALTRLAGSLAPQVLMNLCTVAISMKTRLRGVAGLCTVSAHPNYWAGAGQGALMRQLETD